MQLRYNHQFGLGCLLALLLSAAFSYAQSEQPQRLIHGIDPRDFSWSSDSLIFAFQDRTGGQMGTLVTDESWYKYEVTTGSLTNGNLWPLQPTLSARELALINREAYYPLYLSPDNRYVVYNQLYNGSIAPVMLWDRQTEQSVTTQVDAQGIGAGANYFDVLWSGDSSALAVKTTDTVYAGGPYYYYFSGYTSQLSALQIQPLFPVKIQGQERGYTIRGQGYGTRTVYDLSHNGDQVLLVGGTGGLGLQVIVWNAADPDASITISTAILDGDKVLAASFKPSDESKLILLNDTGLLQYDLVTQAITVLRTDITAEPFRRAVFSPDGHWLALSTGADVDIVNILGDLPAEEAATPEG